MTLVIHNNLSYVFLAPSPAGLPLHLYPDEYRLKQEKSLFSKHVAKYLVPLVHLH